MALDEFALIRRFFARPELARPEPAELVAGIGDDCALLALQAGDELAISMDMLVEGVHFPRDCEPGQLGQRSLRVNLSDLAAMGAEPVCFTLGLALPQADEKWLEAFSLGLAAVASEGGCPLVGGDVTRGPLTVCIQVHGRVPRGRALRRSGAAVGDDIYVTGTLGGAAAALPLITGKTPPDSLNEDEAARLRDAYYRPRLQIRNGLALRGLASAAIDVSDGLASDLQHILDASGTGASVELADLPLSTAFCQSVPLEDQWPLAVRGGDDYCLCFTAPRISRDHVEAVLGDLGAPLHRIGRVETGPGLRWLAPDGIERQLDAAGYRHFSGE